VPPSSHHGIVRSAGIVSAAVFLSRITGLVREMVMARLFGAGQVYDAFLLGFRIPNLTRDLFAEGALSSAFVPIFTRVLQREGRPRAARLANLVATALMVIVGLFCLLGMVFSPALVRLLAPGFSAIPGKHELAVSLTRLMFPFLLLVALAAQAMGILNSVGRFGMPALASSFFNVGSVIAGLTLGFWLGPRVGIPPIYGMAWGVLIGGALQLICQAPSLVRAGFVFRPRLDASDPDLREVLWLMAPAILGNAAVQVNVMVNTNFASAITDAAGRVINGPVSWLSYAFRFMQLPLGLFGVAIASATLPAISRSAASANLAEFRTILSRSLGLVLLLTIPSSLGLVVLGEPMIGAIFQHRAFHASDTIQTARALSFYAIGLAGYAAVKVLAPAFYALGDSRTPMLISLVSIGVNYFTSLTMVRLLNAGHAGLALSTSAVALFGFLVQLFLIRRRLGGIDGRRLASSAARIVAAGLLMTAVAALSTHAMRVWLGVSTMARIADLAVSIPLGAGVFLLFCRLFRVPEIDDFLHALPARFRRA
jgi:putative peptidoglycan lipid II flippase